MSGTAFLDHFSTLDDPRQAWKVVYPLSEILLLVLCGIMAGAETFVEIERWGEGKLGFLRRLRPLARGIPAHDTRNDVMNALPAALPNASSRSTGEPKRGAMPSMYWSSAVGPSRPAYRCWRGIASAGQWSGPSSA